MTRHIKAAPTLKRHRRSGNGYARFNGRQLWFGPLDDPASHARFAAFQARWEANGREIPQAALPDARPLTVADLVALYLEHAEVYYRRQDGTLTHEVTNIRYSVRPLLQLWAALPAGEFELRQLKEVRESMIASGLARPTVNDRIRRLVRLFGWGAEEEHVGAEVFGALRALRPLKRGRSKAPDPAPVRPVPWEHVAATLPYLQPPVRAMVLLMWHTGMRPAEARTLTPGSLDRSGEVWLYRPEQHKTLHYGRARVIAIGPRGQEVLAPYLVHLPVPTPDVPLFSPKEAIAARQRGARSPRNERRVPTGAGPKSASRGWVVGPEYGKDSLARAIARACRRASVPHWAPNQLRHAAATRIRKELGIDAARAVLGHVSSTTTEVYAELDMAQAAEVMARLG